MKFFITHYTPLFERKKHIIEQFDKYNITDYEFIEIYDKELLTKDDTSKYSNDLKVSEISLFLKHVEIFNKEVNDIIVVFEDDALLVDDFMEKLHKYIDELHEYDWDILFSGACCNLHTNIKNNKHIYESNGSRGTCMYIMNKYVNKKIRDILHKESIISKPIDHWFNDMKYKYNLNFYWCEPELVLQGSENGLFKSAIR